MKKYRYSSPLGPMIIETDGDYITRLDFSRDDDLLNGLEDSENNEPGCVKDIKIWLDKYFKGENPPVSDLPLKPKGTEFQMKIWDILKTIQYGKTLTYGEIAVAAGYGTETKPVASQAVGGAVGSNPISIIIPCHRVVGKNGNLTGYAGGMDKKVFLLKTEGHNMDRFNLPRKKK